MLHHEARCIDCFELFSEEGFHMVCRRCRRRGRITYWLCAFGTLAVGILIVLGLHALKVL